MRVPRAHPAYPIGLGPSGPDELLDDADQLVRRSHMKSMLLVYTDTALVDALPEGEMDGLLRTCFDHVDELR